MINKELELTINQQSILNSLANNLGIGTINDNTSIKKIADTFEAELRNYSDATENAIRNGFLSTMDEDLFENFAAGFGIYRKRYGNIRLRPIERVLEVQVEQDTLFSKTLTNFVPFRKGDTLYSNETFSIKTLVDIVFSDVTTSVYPHAEIILKDPSGYSIPEEIYFLVAPQQSGVASFVPQFKIKFNNTVGLVMAEESFSDFRLRVYEATYLASNMANSLVASVTKEVPFLYYVETDNLDTGRAIDVLYPYTKELIETGVDPLVDAVVVPMVETAIASRTLHSNMYEVKTPKSIPIIVKFKYKEGLQPAQSVLNTISAEFNRSYFNEKRITAAEIKSQILQGLYMYDLNINDLSLIFINPDLVEETYTLNDSELIQIPVGKFLTVVAIEGIKDVT